MADTSVWVDHLRKGNDRLVALMNSRSLLVHAFVIGELALGGPRANMVALLQSVTQARRADDDEVLRFILAQGLNGKGIGYVDAHLLVSTLLTPGAKLWTEDRKLRAVARALNAAA